MKTLLLIMNVLLGTGVLYGLFVNLRSVETLKVKKNSQKQIVEKQQTPKRHTTQFTAAPMDGKSEAEQIKVIIDNNIFNSERSPNANVRGGRGRVELTLVGVFMIGKTKGAIIRQKSGAQPQMRPGMFGMMGGFPGGGFPGGAPDGGNVSANNASARNSNRGGAASGNYRNRFSGNASGQGGRRGNNLYAGGNTSATTAAGQTLTYKQYVRVGETLSNGYTLTDVTRTRAVLTRGSDKMELEIVDASKSITTSAKRATPTAAQQMQQTLQQMQQMQRMQMMQQGRMMQQMMQGGQQQNARGGASGNGRRR